MSDGAIGRLRRELQGELQTVQPSESRASARHARALVPAGLACVLLLLVVTARLRAPPPAAPRADEDDDPLFQRL